MATVRTHKCERGGVSRDGPTSRILAVVPVNCRFENMAVNQRLRTLLEMAPVDIVTSYPGGIRPDIAGRTRIQSFPLSRTISATALKNPIFTAELVFWSALERLRGRRYQLIYTIQDTSAVAGLILARRARDWVMDVLDDPAQSYANATQNRQRSKALLLRISERAVGRLLRSAGLVFTIGERADDVLPLTLARDYRVDASRIHPFRQSVDVKRIRSMTADVCCQPPTRRPRAIFVGYVSRLRGVDTLISAIDILGERGVEIDMVLVGHLKEPDRGWMKSAARRYPGIQYRGVLSSPKALREMACATVGILPFPDRRETAPVQAVTGIEYLALGKPIIATDLPGARTLVEHEVNGLLVPPGDAAAMADAIALIACDDRRAYRMGQASRRKAAAFEAHTVRKEITHVLCGD